MSVFRKLGIASAIVALSTALSSGGALADSRMFVAYLYGGNEVPNDGDPNAFGIATVVATTATQLCYSYILKDAAVATAAHIHTGAAGIAGPILVPLAAPANNPTRVSGCVTVPAATVTEIRQSSKLLC